MLGVVLGRPGRWARVHGPSGLVLILLRMVANFIQLLPQKRLSAPRTQIVPV